MSLTLEPMVIVPIFLFFFTSYVTLAGDGYKDLILKLSDQQLRIAIELRLGSKVLKICEFFDAFVEKMYPKI